MDQAPQFGPYTIIREIARGGMGIVYLAEDLAGIRVALKLPRPELATDPNERARFVQEMRLTASLHHPNIVQILQGGDERGHLYIAMEYVEGSTLRTEIDRRGRLPPLETIRIAAQVARGLAAAHERRPAIVHRDLKPGNILLRSDGVAKVTDFGIAKAFEVGAQATTSPMGTPIYMSPEQLNGNLSSPASDVHALGVILYEALVGVPPFSPSLPLARLIHAICFDVPPAVSAASRGDASAIVELDALVAECLAKAPERRPSAASIAVRLHEIESRLAAGPERPLPPPVSPRAAQPAIDTISLVQGFERARSPVLVIVAISLAMVGFGTTAWWLSRDDAPAQAPPRATTAEQTPAVEPDRPAPPPATPEVKREPPAPPPPDAPKPLSVMPLDGLTLAEGPVGGLDAFCRARRARDRASDELTCKITEDLVAASATVRNVGTVSAIELDVNGFEKYYGLLFESGDAVPTTYVLPQLETVMSGGNEYHAEIEAIRIEPLDDGRANVDFVVKHSQRIHDDSKAGFEMDVRKTLKTSTYLCGVTARGVPGCRRH